MLIFEQKTDCAESSDKELRGYSPKLVRLLRSRGVKTALEAEEFMNPASGELFDAFTFVDMKKAVERIKAAVEKGEAICVYGDYDADGVCATAMLYDYLKSEGARCSYHIPSRHSEGYGMNCDAVRALSEDGINLIITVDNGIKAHTEIELARSLGIQVIVTDHHRCADTLPDAYAIICPTVPGCGYENSCLCGAGVAFKLVWALGGRERAMKYISLAALATLADSVPLSGENRAVAAIGISAVNSGEAPAGLLALGNIMREKRTKYTERDFIYGFAPRLNAAGRLKDASIGVELLTCTNEEKAVSLSRELNDLNALRQAEEAVICRQAYAMADASDITFTQSIVLCSKDWNPGIVGISASRIAERYFRPTILFCEQDGILTGSARSVGNIDLYSALKMCEHRFIRYGGHAFAAGITMQKEELEAFIAEFDNALREVAGRDAFIPRKQYESDAEISEITLSLAEDIERLAPFGEGNPTPLYLVRGAKLSHITPVGTDKQHLKFTVRKNNAYAQAVAFGLGEKADEYIEMDECDIVFTPAVNEYNGRCSLQLLIDTVHRGRPEDTVAYVNARSQKFYSALSRNVLYNDSRTAFDCIPCNADELAKEALERDFAGTLILCFTPQGAKQLIDRLYEWGLAQRADIVFTSVANGPCAYNTVLLAPEFRGLDLSRFRDAIIYDSPVCTQAYDLVKKACPNARIVSGGTYADGDATADKAAFTRDDLVPLYIAAKEAGSFVSEREFVQKLRENTAAPAHKCEAGAVIMRELGFVELNSKGNVVFNAAAAKKDLTLSCAYSRLNSLSRY